MPARQEISSRISYLDHVAPRTHEGGCGSSRHERRRQETRGKEGYPAAKDAALLVVLVSPHIDFDAVNNGGSPRLHARHRHLELRLAGLQAGPTPSGFTPAVATAPLCNPCEWGPNFSSLNPTLASNVGFQHARRTLWRAEIREKPSARTGRGSAPNSTKDQRGNDGGTAPGTEKPIAPSNPQSKRTRLRESAKMGRDSTYDSTHDRSGNDAAIERVGGGGQGGGRDLSWLMSPKDTGLKSLGVTLL